MIVSQYRTVKIAWRPRSQAQWATFTAARMEAGRLWSDLTVRHARLRRMSLRFKFKWPSKARWQQWAKGKYPGLAAQSTQQIIGEFCEALASASALRKNGQAEARYPWRKTKYRDITYTNQSATIRGGVLRLPNGTSGVLVVRMPRSIILPGRLMEAHLTYGAVLLICKIEDASILARGQAVPAGLGHVAREDANLTEDHSGGQGSIGIDLGVNTLIAATDGKRAILVSGRAIKADVQWRNKCLAGISQRMSQHQRGSCRYKRLRRRMYRVLEKSHNRILDATHKATRIVADAFPGATVYVGEPFNDAAQKLGRRQAQQVSQACNRKIIQQLDYKTSGAIVVNEAYSSQTCPVCGYRQKCRRVYKCKNCGFSAPRDVVGALNIRQIGKIGALSPQPDLKCPSVTWRHPVKYPDHKSGSSGGPPVRSTLVTA